MREVPDLQKLIERIIQEHCEEQKIQTNDTQYKIPLALIFFVEKFIRYYEKLWKTNLYQKCCFLPSYALETAINQSNKNEVILSATNQVFTVVNPLFPSLLPDVIKLIEKHFQFSLLGIRDHPSLTQAFRTVLEKKNKLLTEESAPKIFAYLNSIEGLNGAFIELASQSAFIPLKG